MNLADAIRAASEGASPLEAVHVAPVQPMQKQNSESQVTHPEAVHPAVQGGNVVRLELFLNPEQETSLLRAISHGQHSVFTLKEAASYLRIPAQTLQKLAEEGEIPGVQLDGRWRFPKPNLDEWMSVKGSSEEDHAA